MALKMACKDLRIKKFPESPRSPLHSNPCIINLRGMTAPMGVSSTNEAHL